MDICNICLVNPSSKTLLEYASEHRLYLKDSMYPLLKMLDCESVDISKEFLFSHISTRLSDGGVTFDSFSRQYYAKKQAGLIDIDLAFSPIKVPTNNGKSKTTDYLMTRYSFLDNFDIMYGESTLQKEYFGQGWMLRRCIRILTDYVSHISAYQKSIDYLKTNENHQLGRALNQSEIIYMYLGYHSTGALLLKPGYSDQLTNTRHTKIKHQFTSSGELSNIFLYRVFYTQMYLGIESLIHSQFRKYQFPLQNGSGKTEFMKVDDFLIADIDSFIKQNSKYFGYTININPAKRKSCHDIYYFCEQKDERDEILKELLDTLKRNKMNETEFMRMAKKANQDRAEGHSNRMIFFDYLRSMEGNVLVELLPYLMQLLKSEALYHLLRSLYSTITNDTYDELGNPV